MDLADVFTAPAAPQAADPWGGPVPVAAALPAAAPTSDPWGGPPVPPAADPWGGPAPTPASGDPWRPAAPAGPPVDPWGGTAAPVAGEGPTPDPWGSSDGECPLPPWPCVWRAVLGCLGGGCPAAVGAVGGRGGAWVRGTHETPSPHPGRGPLGGFLEASRLRGALPEGGAWQCEPQGWRVGTWWEGPAGEGPEASGLPGFGGAGWAASPSPAFFLTQAGPQSADPQAPIPGPRPRLSQTPGGGPVPSPAPMAPQVLGGGPGGPGLECGRSRVTWAPGEAEGTP